MKKSAVDWPNLLVEFRTSRRLKQKAAADYFGVSQSTISRWERGVDEPSIAARNALLRGLRHDRSPTHTLEWVETYRKLPVPGSIISEGGIHRAVTEGLVEIVGAPRHELEGLPIEELFHGEVLEAEALLVAEQVFSGRVVSLEGCVFMAVNPQIRKGVNAYVHTVAWPHLSETGGVRLVTQGLPVSADRARALRAQFGGAWKLTFAG